MDRNDEVLGKLREASKQDDVFVLKLEHNGEQVVEEIKFSISKYHKLTIEAPKLYYMLLDFSRQLQNELDSQDKKNRLKKK